MNRIINYNISPDEESTIERFLRSKGYTRQSLIELKKWRNSTLVNGVWEHQNHVLKAGDTLTISITEDSSSEKIPPVNLPFPIVYEDEDIVVVNKPFDMPIHPSLNNYDNSLANAAAYYYANQNEKFVFRCINRLDRDTSGLTIIAKHFVSAGILYNQMKNRQIHREYVAIVEGNFDDDNGTINLPIGRVNGSTIERCVDMENGEEAITHYKVIDFHNNMSMISLNLDTGRTHQIRVHMKAVGHPLIGDFLYNPDNKLMNRQALCSKKLSFTHPISGESLVFEIDLPEDMQKLWNKKIQAVIFDMDGTILNTIDDIAGAVNYILGKYNLPLRSVDEVKSFVGNGLHRTLELSVSEDCDPSFVDEIYEEFTDYYKNHSNIFTRPYDGIVPAITAMKNHGLKLAVVSNKRIEAVRELCDLFYKDLFDEIMGDTAGINRKPAPDMVNIVLNNLGIDKEHAVYVGDSDVDIKTANNSLLEGIFVSWGFRTKEFLIENGATCIVDTPSELLNIIC